MNDRVARGSIAALAVVCLALVGSVIYPVTTADPHVASPQDERFAVGDADAFRASGTIVVEGERVLAFEGAVAADGEWYQRVEEPTVTSETYHSPGDGPVYERIAVESSEHAEALREAVADDPDRELLRQGRDGDRMTLVVAKNDSTAAEPVSGTASVFVRSLFVAGYEAAGTGSPGVTVYEPRDGWYRGTRPYRITAASGEVRVDADTGAVRTANVSWDVTKPAGTYARYVLVSLAGDGQTTRRITVEFRPGEPEIERPTWVPRDASG